MKYHYFDIDTEQFTCHLDYDYKRRWLWYSTAGNNHCLFGIDLKRGFQNKENCENYIRKQVFRTCKKLLKGLK